MSSLKKILKKVEDNRKEGLDFISLNLNKDLKIKLFGGVKTNPSCNNSTCHGNDGLSGNDNNSSCTNDVCNDTDHMNNNGCTNKKCT